MPLVGGRLYSSASSASGFRPGPRALRPPADDRVPVRTARVSGPLLPRGTTPTLQERRSVRHAREENGGEGEEGPQGREEADDRGRGVRSRGDGPHPPREARSALDEAGHRHRPVQGAQGRRSPEATPEGSHQPPHAAGGEAGLRGRPGNAEAEVSVEPEKAGHLPGAPARAPPCSIEEGALHPGTAHGRTPRPAVPHPTLNGGPSPVRLRATGLYSVPSAGLRPVGAGRRNRAREDP
jgi:hypothetical protein